MTCKEANEILITDFLYSNGIEPKRVVGNNYWYLSPLREETTPSMKVDTNINRWYDHGMGVGGKLVDLGIRFHQVTVSEFLEKIEGQNFPNSFSFQKPEIIIHSPIIKKVNEIENKALVNYLKYRAIDRIEIAQSFCKEVYFSVNEKSYFGIGFKNDFGGYEIRSKYFKGCIGSKAITTIEGKVAKTIVMFEGFFDFLSAYQQFAIKDFSFIILNSVNQITHAMEYLMIKNPDLILTYFDNDDAGRKCFQTLRDCFPNTEDQSNHYNNHKDLNEMIRQTKNKNHG